MKQNVLAVKINVLISGLGGSLFPYLHDQLNKKFNLYYVDGHESLTKLYPEYNFITAPLVTNDDYNDFIKNIIKEHNIKYYIPLIDEELIQAKDETEGYLGVRVISPTVEFCKLSLNKFKLMGILKYLNISDIKSFIGNSFTWEDGKIIFAKPVSGRGSRGIKRIESKKQLDAYYLLEDYKPDEILIQEYITGVEYTVGATVNSLNQLLSVSIKRVIRKKGITQIAVTEENAALFKVVQNVVAQLRPCGPINIQLYLTPKNEVKIFEINPRFSTTTIMSYAGGLDEISLYIDNYDTPYNYEPLQPKNGIVLHRRWESVFYEQ